MADVVLSNSPWSEAFHFRLKDEHLVKFLQDRLLGRPVPGIQGIRFKDVNVYDDLTPQEIFAKSEYRGPNESDKERYCFTQLKRTTPGGKRFVRTTSGGTWKLQHGNDVIGGTALKRSFSYKRSMSGSSGPQVPDDYDWVMYEYSLQGQDIALCKIIKKKSSKKRDRSEQDEEDMLRKGSSKSCHWTLKTTNTEDNAPPLPAAMPNVDNGLLMGPDPKPEDNMMYPTILIPASSTEWVGDFEAHFAPAEMFDIAELLKD